MKHTSDSSNISGSLASGRVPLGLESLKNEGTAPCLKLLFQGSSSDSESDHESDRVTRSDIKSEQLSIGEDCLAIEPTDQEAIAESIFHVSESHIGAHVGISLAQCRVKGIAHQLWPAAEAMCRYLFKSPTVVFRDAPPSEYIVIELGAGIGLVGLFASSLGCRHVLLTDLPEAMPLLERNIGLNGMEEHVSAKGILHLNDYWFIISENAFFFLNLFMKYENSFYFGLLVLRWGIPEDTDICLKMITARMSAEIINQGSRLVVLLADCVYWECLFKPLVSTILQFINYGADVVMCHVKRWKKDSIFFSLCKKMGISVELLHEAVEMVPEEHTNQLSRRITRFYRFSSIEKSPAPRTGKKQLGIKQKHESKSEISVPLSQSSAKNSTDSIKFSRPQISSLVQDCMLQFGYGIDQIIKIEDATGGINNFTNIITVQCSQMGDTNTTKQVVLRVYNNGNREDCVDFEHFILETIQSLGIDLPFFIPTAVPPSIIGIDADNRHRESRNYIILPDHNTFACVFEFINGGIPNISSVEMSLSREPCTRSLHSIGRACGTIVNIMALVTNKLQKLNKLVHSPTKPAYDIFTSHHGMNRTLFLDTIRESQFDSHRVYLDFFLEEITLLELKLKISYRDVVVNEVQSTQVSCGADLPRQLIHNDLHHVNMLCDAETCRVTGVLDFEFVAMDFRAMELAISLCKLSGESNPLELFECLFSGYSEVSSLNPSEICLLPSLISLHIVSNVVYFVGRFKSHDCSLSFCISRLESYCNRIRWIRNNEADIISLLHEKFVQNEKYDTSDNNNLEMKDEESVVS